MCVCGGGGGGVRVCVSGGIIILGAVWRKKKIYIYIYIYIYIKCIHMTTLPTNRMPTTKSGCTQTSMYCEYRRAGP